MKSKEEKINNKEIENVIMKKNKPKKENKYYFSSGCDLLDIVTGGGLYKGYEAGRIINIVGDKSSGKTFLACELIACSYYLYRDQLKWVYDDCESGFTFDTSFLYGINIISEEDIERVRSNTVEELYCNYRNFLENIKKNELGIYVIDSLDGLSSNEMLGRSNERYKKWQNDKKFDKGSYQMGAAKFLSQEFFRGLAGMTQEKNVLLVIISQVRDNIDPMSFKKFKRSGGNALDHYSNTVLWLASAKKIKIKDKVVGLIIKAKLDKSKTPRPYRECMFPVYFDYGIDNIGANIDYLYDLRTPTGDLTSSGKKEIIWEDKKFNYREDLIDYIEKNKLLKILREKVEEKWEKIEESLKTKRSKKYIMD